MSYTPLIIDNVLTSTLTTHVLASSQGKTLKDALDLETSNRISGDALCEQLSNKNASSGYVGLTNLNINFKNTANTFTSFLTNTNTSSRTYTFPDKNIIVAGLDDIQQGSVPIATSYILGGIKVGSGLTVTPDGTLGLPLTNTITPIRNRFAGGVIADWSSEKGSWVDVTHNSGDSLILDSTTICMDKPAAKISVNSAAVSLGWSTFEYVFNSNISLSNVNSITIPIKITNNRYISNVVPIEIRLYDASDRTVNLKIDTTGVSLNSWGLFTWNRYDVGGNQISTSGGISDIWGFFDTTLIVKIGVIVSPLNGPVTSMPIWLGPINTNARAMGVVSIRMDRNLESQYTTLKPLFDAVNIKTTLAIDHDNIGQQYYMTDGQISDMVAGGHEVIHTTYQNIGATLGYGDFNSWSYSSLISNDIRLGWQYCNTMGWKTGIGKMVESKDLRYTGINSSITTSNSIREAQEQAGVDTTFIIGVDNSTMQMPIGRKFEFKPTGIRSPIQIKSTTTTTNIINAINAAEQNGTWLIITIDDPAHMLLSDHNIWINYLSTRIQAGNLVCDTLSRVFDSAYTDKNSNTSISTGYNSGINTGDETTLSIKNKLGPIINRVNTAGVTNNNYGSISITGTNNSYAGINFDDIGFSILGTSTQFGLGRCYTDIANSSVQWGLWLNTAGLVFTYTHLIVAGSAYVSGDVQATGNVSAYSDERLKTNWIAMDSDFIERWSQVKCGSFDRTDINTRQVGLSAQSVQPILPEAITVDDNKLLSLNYGAVAAVATVELSKRVIELEKTVDQLLDLIKNLVK